MGPRLRGEPEFVAKWERLRDLRLGVSAAIEPFRRDKIIRSSLEAEVAIRLKDAPATDSALSLAKDEFEELLIVSSAQVTGFAHDSTAETKTIEVTRTANHKCGRCWRHLPEVTEDGNLCDRCSEMLA